MSLNDACKEYIEVNNLEETLDVTINEILRNLPLDPFSSMVELLQDKCASSLQIKQVEIGKTINSDFVENVCISMKSSFKGNNFNIKYDVPFSSTSYESGEDIVDKTITIFDEYFKVALCQDLQINDFHEMDLILDNLYEKMLSNEKAQRLLNIGLNLLNAISYTTILSLSTVNGKSIAKYLANNYRKQYDQLEKSKSKISYLGIVIFSCFKSTKTKIKFEKFLLIIDLSDYSSINSISESLLKLHQSIRKVLTAGKLGESGIKLNSEGSYTSPFDNTVDTLKLINQIIDETSESNIYIGIDCNANNYYSEGKYEIEGSKKPIASSELIEYYSKLCSNNKKIIYLEDALSEDDNEGWKLIEKFQTTNEQVFIGCKRKFKTYESIIQNCQSIKIEESKNSNLDKAEISKIEKENASKLKPDFISFNINEYSSYDKVFQSFSLIRHDLISQKKIKMSIWDSEYESNQSLIIDIASSLGIDMVILNGLNIKQERFSKYRRFLELIDLELNEETL